MKRMAYAAGFLAVVLVTPATLAQEAVARFAAAEFGLPTTIARMNAAYGEAMVLHLLKPAA